MADVSTDERSTSEGPTDEPSTDAAAATGDETTTSNGTAEADRRSNSDDPLLAWALASFHAAVLLVAPLAGAHAVSPSAVGDLLGGLDTLVGLALYLVLWGSTWVTNRRYLAASAFDDAAGTLRAGARWGAVTGLPLLGCVVLAALVATNPVIAVILLVAGGLVAPLVGALVGVVFAGVDVAFYRLVGTVLS